jgi:hypothetical protein
MPSSPPSPTPCVTTEGRLTNVPTKAPRPLKIRMTQRFSTTNSRCPFGSGSTRTTATGWAQVAGECRQSDGAQGTPNYKMTRRDALRRIAIVQGCRWGMDAGRPFLEAQTSGWARDSRGILATGVLASNPFREYNSEKIIPTSIFIGMFCTNSRLINDQ